MKQLLRLFRCDVCGKIVEELEKGSENLLKCCDKDMVLLKPERTKQGAEKHKPIILKDKNVVTVKVGDVEHPMVRNHLIKWIEVITSEKSVKKILSCKEKPVLKLNLNRGENVLLVRSYCNKHGLWQTKL